MKVAEPLLATCVLALAGFIGLQSLEVKRVETHSEAAGAIESTPATSARARRGAARGTKTPRFETPAIAPAIVPAIVPTSVLLTNPTPAFLDGATDGGKDRDTRRRIAQGAPGTYIDELLAQRDSALARWPERTRRPLRVWVHEAEGNEGWSADFASAVRDAFLTWGEAGIPLRFDFVRDSANADIEVRFVDALPNGISGKTIWSRDADWWLVSSSIQLALVHPSGGFVTPPQMRAIALHEVGHLLGLDHTAASDNIMAARVRVRELSEADRATARLLYSVPAGSLK